MLKNGFMWHCTITSLMETSKLVVDNGFVVTKIEDPNGRLTPLW